jgi:hypothetical protein
LFIIVDVYGMSSFFLHRQILCHQERFLPALLITLSGFGIQIGKDNERAIGNRRTLKTCYTPFILMSPQAAFLLKHRQLFGLLEKA